MATQARAKVGGEVGTNGEFYEGGKFLPSTQKAKGTPRKKGLRKVEIEPYVWVVPTDDRRSIFNMLAGIWAKHVNGRFVVSYSPVTLAYYNGNPDKIQKLAEMYNAGERWADFGCSN